VASRSTCPLGPISRTARCPSRPISGAASARTASAIFFQSLQFLFIFDRRHRPQPTNLFVDLDQFLAKTEEKLVIVELPLSLLQFRSQAQILRPGIGVVGASFIVRDIQLIAYANAGYKVVAICSQDLEATRQVATLRAVHKVYANYVELLGDPGVEIVDIAIPPDQQLAVVREAVCYSSHIKGILCQKPLAVTLTEAQEIVVSAAKRESNWA